jgi:hypothetical protein
MSAGEGRFILLDAAVRGVADDLRLQYVGAFLFPLAGFGQMSGFVAYWSTAVGSVGRTVDVDLSGCGERQFGSGKGSQQKRDETHDAPPNLIPGRTRSYNPSVNSRLRDALR